ncbi:unnamed protein product [Phytophthora lilii]|uniref:Unnamed protein product n=1 Tax=Phytophthora lilii TaxID=2077276 RepID=A0A9W6X6K0_9STRA|nr:unnamed protein product [Phytophthora lilii]
MDNKVFRTSKAPLATKPYAPPDSTAPAADTPPTTPAPPTWTQPPPTPAPVTVSVEDEIEEQLKIMFPAWLWDPTPPKVFVSDGRHQQH